MCALLIAATTVTPLWHEKDCDDQSATCELVAGVGADMAACDGAMTGLAHAHDHDAASDLQADGDCHDAGCTMANGATNRPDHDERTCATCHEIKMLSAGSPLLAAFNPPFLERLFIARVVMPRSRYHDAIAFFPGDERGPPTAA